MIHSLAVLIRPWTTDIALALIATLLVIYGDAINGVVRRLVRKQPVWIRVAVFVSLCTFGYGALTVWLVPQVAGFLGSQPDMIYVALVLAGFLLLGVLAERFHRWSEINKAAGTSCPSRRSTLEPFRAPGDHPC